MPGLSYYLLNVFAIALLIGGCATSLPVNPPIAKVDRNTGYRYVTRAAQFKDKENLVVLAFSGGGTRAAAFSYGVLEALRPMELTGRKGGKIRMLDEVDVIAGVGSFTALAYGLHGEKLFDFYESSFIKRNVQGDLLHRVLNPSGWTAWGRSETASKLYDEILFHGATFADLDRGKGPFVVASATDITSGARIGFHQGIFDVLCSDLNAVSLARAATASSAVPLAFSPVTLHNYGGTCNYAVPAALSAFSDPAAASTPRPAARYLSHVQDLLAYEDSVHLPYIHLLDGGLSDNLGMRGILETLDNMEALKSVGEPTPLDSARRIVLFVVNSRSTPRSDWPEKERPPNEIALLIKATGIPIDHYSYDTVETLKDTVARWQTLRRLAASPAFVQGKDPSTAKLLLTPSVDLYVIDVSFAAVKDETERSCLNNLPTSFALPPEAVDRLRAAAATIIRDSPEFKRLLNDAGVTMTIGPDGGAD